jgi:hypothetical protein
MRTMQEATYVGRRPQRSLLLAMLRSVDAEELLVSQGLNPSGPEERWKASNT